LHHLERGSVKLFTSDKALTRQKKGREVRPFPHAVTQRAKALGLPDHFLHKSSFVSPRYSVLKATS
jgi:hypothetical protein